MVGASAVRSAAGFGRDLPGYVPGYRQGEQFLSHLSVRLVDRVHIYRWFVSLSHHISDYTLTCQTVYLLTTGTSGHLYADAQGPAALVQLPQRDATGYGRVVITRQEDGAGLGVAGGRGVGY